MKSTCLLALNKPPPGLGAGRAAEGRRVDGEGGLSPAARKNLPGAAAGTRRGRGCPVLFDLQLPRPKRSHKFGGRFHQN